MTFSARLQQHGFRRWRGVAEPVPLPEADGRARAELLERTERAFALLALPDAPVAQPLAFLRLGASARELLDRFVEPQLRVTLEDTTVVLRFAAAGRHFAVAVLGLTMAATVPGWLTHNMRVGIAYWMLLR